MATIDDYGNTDQALNAPPLGGPAGWAKAVRDAIMDRLPLSGGRLSGELQALALSAMKDGNYGPRLSITDAAGDGTSFTRINGVAAALVTTAAAGITTTRARLKVGTPTDADDAATKGYVDRLLGTGRSLTFGPINWWGNGNGQFVIDAANFGLESIDYVGIMSWATAYGHIFSVVDANPRTFTVMARGWDGTPFAISGNHALMTLIIGLPA